MKRERSVLLNTCMHLMVSEDFGRAVHSLRAAQLRQGNLRYGQPAVFDDGNESA